MYRKKSIIILLATLFILSGCAKAQADIKDAAQDPLAVSTGNRVFHYGDTREEIEEILGTESSTPINTMEYYRKYPDGTQIIYRETEGEEIAVLIMIKGNDYTTYQGIHVGDDWNKVRESLGEVAETKTSALILFQDSEQIDPWTSIEERRDDSISISYVFNAQGTIESITVSDNLAARRLK